MRPTTGEHSPDDRRTDYSAAVFPATFDPVTRGHVAIAEQVLPLLDETSDRRFSEPNRWGGSGLEEQPLRPELVAEVRYDKVQGRRFRHGTKLLRFRPDKNPTACTWAELRPPRPADGPTVADLLGR